MGRSGKGKMPSSVFVGCRVRENTNSSGWFIIACVVTFPGHEAQGVCDAVNDYYICLRVRKSSQESVQFHRICSYTWTCPLCSPVKHFLSWRRQIVMAVFIITRCSELTLHRRDLSTVRSFLAKAPCQCNSSRTRELGCIYWRTLLDRVCCACVSMSLQKCCTHVCCVWVVGTVLLHHGEVSPTHFVWRVVVLLFLVVLSWVSSHTMELVNMKQIAC